MVAVSAGEIKNSRKKVGNLKFIERSRGVCWSLLMTQVIRDLN